MESSNNGLFARRAVRWAIFAAILLLQRGPAQPQAETTSVRGGGPPLAMGPVDSLPPVPAEGAAANVTQPAESLAAPGPATPQAPLFTAWVRARPPGTQIRAIGQEGTWSDTVELSVPAGDTLRLEFSRAGYVTRRQPFTGSRLVVSRRRSRARAVAP